MPIKPVFTWQETEQGLEVTVSLPGASRSKSDVFATECMLKVNLAPYLLVLDLYGEVDSSRTVATFVGNEGVTFKLFKRKPGLWGQLEAEGSKEQLTQRRNASVERAHAQAEQARKERLQRKQAEERAAVDRQIDMERRRRQMLEAAKQAELTAERDGLNSWRKQLAASGPGTDGLGADGTSAPKAGDESDYESDGEGEGAQKQAHDASMPDNPYYHGKGWWPSQQHDRCITGGDAGDADSDSEDASHSKEPGSGSSNNSTIQHVPSSDGSCAAVQSQEADSQAGGQFESPQDSWQPLPPPRMRAEAVKVEFTPLEMPHLPAREQREEELKVYKKQQAAVQQGDSADVADRQPLFLKDKGDALFAQGNYRGALAAYTRALELGGILPALWSNRAAAHAKLGQHTEAVADCDSALQMLQLRQARSDEGALSDVELAALRKQLARVLARRAAAHTALGHLQSALTDCEEALKFEPGNARLAADAEELRAALQQPTGTRTDTSHDPAAAAEAVKARGAARFAAGDYLGAVEAFNVLLALPTPAQLSGLERVAGLSNRAAAHLAMGDYTAAVSDCCTGIAVALHSLYKQQQQQQHAQGQQGKQQRGEPGCEEGIVQSQVEGDVRQQDEPFEVLTSESTCCDGSPAAAATAAVNAWPLHSHGPDNNSEDGRRAGGRDGGVLGACSSADTEDANKKLRAWVSAVAICGHVGNSHTTSDAGAGSACDNSTTLSWIGCIGRLLSRRAAAQGHLKQYLQAAEDFEAGAKLIEATGAGDKAAALRADAAQMQSMMQAVQ